MTGGGAVPISLLAAGRMSFIDVRTMRVMTPFTTMASRPQMRRMASIPVVMEPENSRRPQPSIRRTFLKV